MKEQIINALRTKYQRFGLTNEAIDRIASAKEKTVTSEADIDAAIADAETMGLIAQEAIRMRDREIQNRTDLNRAFEAYKVSHPETKADEGEQADAEPEWAKRLREQNEAITARLDAAEKKTARESAVKAVLSAAKADCPDEKVFKLASRGFALREGEDEAAAVERLKGDYSEIKKEYFSNGPIPPFGGGDVTDKGAIEARMKAFAKAKGFGEAK